MTATKCGFFVLWVVIPVDEHQLSFQNENSYCTGYDGKDNTSHGLSLFYSAFRNACSTFVQANSPNRLCHPQICDKKYLIGVNLKNSIGWETVHYNVLTLSILK